MRYEEPSVFVIGKASVTVQGAGNKGAHKTDGSGGNPTSTGSFYDMDE